MQLTTNFSLEEMIRSDAALRLGINNWPSSTIQANLLLVAQALECVRTKLGGKPILVTSGYRCPSLNTAVGGAKDSAHMSGWAADFRCPEFGAPQEIVRFLAGQEVKFDQLIQEGTWVHLSVAPAMRQEVLTAHFAGGNVTYTEGV